MFVLSIIQAVLIFALIAAWSVTTAQKRIAIARFGPGETVPETMTMKRASLRALVVLAAVPAAAIVSFLLGTLSANIAFGASRLPAEFWETYGTVLLAGIVPLGLFIAAREIIFAIGKVRS